MNGRSKDRNTDSANTWLNQVFPFALSGEEKGVEDC